MWSIVGDPEEVAPRADGRAWLYPVEQDGERQTVVVELGGTLLASGVELLDSPLDEAVRTLGAFELTRVLADGARPPVRLAITTGGVRVEL